MLKRFLVIALVGLLAACQPTTNGQTTTSRASTGSLQSQMESFMVNVALSQVYSERCGGIRLKNPDQRAVVNGFVLQLVGQGYTEQQILAATRKARNANLGQKAVQSLIAKGVQPGDINSLCRAARSEISGNTAVGALMRRA